MQQNKVTLSGELLPFGVLDLCKRTTEQSNADAVSEIIKLAELTDQLGYCRYWLAEHHVPFAVTSAPELLLPLMAARTRKIRIGTGGIIMGYYSAYRIAEIANTLQTLSGGRFDLGLCRGPGVVDDAIAEELVSGNLWELQAGVFARKVGKTVSLIRAGKDSRERVKIHTSAENIPELWLLGSNASSATLANNFDMSLALALFITGDENKAFQNNQLFVMGQGSENCSRKSMLAVSIVCADTDKKALTRHEQLVNEGCMSSNLIGSYKNITERLLILLHKFDIEELLIVLLSRNPEERIDTYRSLAEYYRTFKSQ